MASVPHIAYTDREGGNWLPCSLWFVLRQLATCEPVNPARGPVAAVRIGTFVYDFVLKYYGYRPLRRTANRLRDRWLPC